MITELLEICFIVKRDEPQMLESIKTNLKILEKKMHSLNCMTVKSGSSTMVPAFTVAFRRLAPSSTLAQAG